MTALRKFIGFSRNPWVMVFAGMFLTVASLYELGAEILAISEGVKVQHATLFYGFIVTIRSLGVIDESIGMVAEVVIRSEGQE